MRKISKRAKIVVAGAVALTLAGGGVAFAYWSTTGAGSGSATTSTGASSLTFTDTTPSGAVDLAPGGPGVVVSGTVTNNAPNSAKVNSVTVSIASVVQAANATGSCDATDYTITSPSMTVGQDLAHGATANFSGATLSFVDKATTNQDGCKGATVNLTYTSN